MGVVFEIFPAASPPDTQSHLAPQFSGLESPLMLKIGFRFSLQFLSFVVQRICFLKLS